MTEREIIQAALVMGLTGHEGGTVRQVERAIKWAMTQAITEPPRPFPPPDPWMRHVYKETGIGGAFVKMNQVEREHADARPWYRRIRGLPSQAEVDSWGLERVPF